MEQEEAWVAAAGRLRRAPPSSSEQTGQGERWRLPLIALVTLAHAGLLYWLQGAVDAGAASPIPAEPLQVMLLQEAPPSPPPPPPPVRPPRRVSVPASAPRAVVPEQPRAVANAVVPFAPAPATDPAIDAPRLYSADGSIAVPDAVLDDLAAVTRPDRVFSYQTRGLLHARHFLQRPPAMVYEATRFDAAWVEEKDLFTEALERAVEKTTMTITLPVPRSPGTKIVCKVSVLAAGGACGFVNNGRGYLVMLDDPDTLDGEEDRQCRDWWQGIVAARTPEDWADALDRYEAHCRKPLEPGRAPPLPGRDSAAGPTPAAASG